MSIAVFGGVFDPIHNLHLDIASQALAKYSLSKVIFVPSNLPPHKNPPGANATQRLEMLTLALKSLQNTSFELSSCEIERAGVSYTIDTLHLLKPDYLILGEDAYQELDTWKQPEEIRKLVKFIVIPRDNPLSSSQIRAKVCSGVSLASLVPSEVEDYIRVQGLYSQ